MFRLDLAVQPNSFYGTQLELLVEAGDIIAHVEYVLDPVGAA